MQFALTTRWNAHRHTSGEAMIEEILDMGFTRVELGYDTRRDLVPGIQKMVEQRAVQVDSVHNFCPLPMSAPRGHPEIFTFGSLDLRVRELAIVHTAESIRFAASIGARAVVTHCGNIDMERYTEQLVAMAERGQQFTPLYENMKLKMLTRREKKARKQIAYWYECIERLLPVLEEQRIQLAMENLPTWEAIPTETEMETLLKHFNSPWLKSWFDMGHAQIRENLGLINVERWLERLHPHIAGMHVHDVEPPGRDHVMPPLGKTDFSRYKRFATEHILKVIEPTTRTERGDIEGALRYLRENWAAPDAPHTETSEQRMD